MAKCVNKLYIGRLQYFISYDSRTVLGKRKSKLADVKQNPDPQIKEAINPNFTEISN